MTRPVPQDLILAIHATSHGFSFLLLSGPTNPFDWGISAIRNPSRNRKCVAAIAKLIEEFQPLAIVLEDTSERHSKRTARIRRLYQSVAHLASANGIDLHRVKRTSIREAFAFVGAVTKYEIAQAIAIQIPALASRLPPARKAWMSQDVRQSLFDAAALGLTFYSDNPRYLS